MPCLYNYVFDVLRFKTTTQFWNKGQFGSRASHAYPGFLSKGTLPSFI